MSQPDRNLRNPAGLLVLAAGVAVALACGNPSGEGNGCAGTGAQIVINAQDNQFVPARVTISKGQTVCWQNVGSAQHTVTATSVSLTTDSSWSADSVNQTLQPHSGIFIRTFSLQNANYFYKCTLHNETGEIDVR